MNQKIQQFFTDKDKLWLAIWLCGIALLTIWNALFLNAPAFERVRTGFVNTMLIALLVIGIIGYILDSSCALAIKKFSYHRGHDSEY